MQTNKRNLRNIRAPKNQKGLTLVELAIGLTIVLAVTALVIGVSITTTRSQRTNDVQTQLTTITSQLRTLAPSGNYDGITELVLANSKKIPDSWLTLDGSGVPTGIATPFGGKYVILAADVNGAPAGTKNGFQVTISDLPISACTDIVTNAQANFLKVTAGAAAAPIKDEGDPNATGATIASTCSTAAAGAETVDVTFVAA